jgi:hypothetical protein
VVELTFIKLSFGTIEPAGNLLAVADCIDGSIVIMTIKLDKPQYNYPTDS